MKFNLIRRRLLECAWLVALLSLSGCATVLIEEGSPTATVASQTTSLQSMSFVELGLNKPAAITIDARSPTFELESEPKRVAAFALPESTEQRYISYLAKPYGGHTIGTLKVLVPMFSFMDANRQWLATADSGHMARRLTGGGTLFEGRVAVPSAARFLMVHGNDIAPEPLIIHGGPGHSSMIPASRLGVLTLQISTVGMALVRDSGQDESASKAQLFYLKSVNGVRVENAAGESARASGGRGFDLNILFTTRYVMAKPLKIVVVGSHVTGAPIHAMASMIAGTYWSVETELDFSPEAGKEYVVRGELGRDKSAVWIEDVATGQPVTVKGGGK